MMKKGGIRISLVSMTEERCDTTITTIMTTTAIVDFLDHGQINPKAQNKSRPMFRKVLASEELFGFVAKSLTK
jgi:hypothetical protein